MDERLGCMQFVFRRLRSGFKTSEKCVRQDANTHTQALREGSQLLFILKKKAPERKELGWKLAYFGRLRGRSLTDISDGPFASLLLVLFSFWLTFPFAHILLYTSWLNVQARLN